MMTDDRLREQVADWMALAILFFKLVERAGALGGELVRAEVKQHALDREVAVMISFPIENTAGGFGDGM